MARSLHMLLMLGRRIYGGEGRPPLLPESLARLSPAWSGPLLMVRQLKGLGYLLQQLARAIRRRGAPKQERRPRGETSREGTVAADAAVTDPTKDRFDRWPFAQRVADTIVARGDPSSI